MRGSVPTAIPPRQPNIPAGIRTIARDYANPVDYQHPHESMARFADFLALHYDANRTRHAYYRHLRLIHDHFTTDPATLSEAQLREYFLFVKLKKHWQPKTLRQTVAATKMFFVELGGHTDWTLFSQIRTRDHDTLPAVLTRQQVRDLLGHIRLRRYRTPLKLIYATHLLEAGAHLHTIQSLLGHNQITTTMVYLHLTHQTTQDTLRLIEGLCQGLPQ